MIHCVELTLYEVTVSGRSEVEGVGVSGNRVATSCQLRCQLSVQQHSQPQVPLARVMCNSETEKIDAAVSCNQDHLSESSSNGHTH